VNDKTLALYRKRGGADQSGKKAILIAAALSITLFEGMPIGLAAMGFVLQPLENRSLLKISKRVWVSSAPYSSDDPLA
jgi:hypothetical protein